LFDEWESELDTYSNKRLRNESKAQLTDTKARYRPMILAMRKAEKKIEPVLTAFRDQVLFLKHNLNARAVSSLKGELQVVEADVDELIREMEQSIDEAQSFIDSM